MVKTIAVLAFVFSTSVNAAVTCPKNIKFEESLRVRVSKNKKVNLYLNGIGLKKVLFVKVFYAGLYLENLSQSASTVLNSKKIKVGVIHTLQNAKKKQLVDFWDDEFKRLCGNQCAQLRPYHEQFISYARNVKKGERLYTIFFRDRFEFEANGNEFYEPIRSAAYSKLLQRVLIGPDAKDKSLEDGLLGKKMICKKS